MAFLVAVVLVAWVAILLEALAIAALLRNVAELRRLLFEPGAADGVLPNLLPQSTGTPVGGHEPFPVHLRGKLVLFAKDGCRSCSALLSADGTADALRSENVLLAYGSLDEDSTASLLLRQHDLSNIAIEAMPVKAFDSLGVRPLPLMATVGREGHILRSWVVGSPDALRRALAESLVPGLHGFAMTSRESEERAHD